MVLNVDQAKKLGKIKGVEKIIDGTLIVRKPSGNNFEGSRDDARIKAEIFYLIGEEETKILLDKYRAKGWKISEGFGETHQYFFRPSKR